jgi:hypothetical protein
MSKSEKRLAKWATLMAEFAKALEGITGEPKPARRARPTKKPKQAAAPPKKLKTTAPRKRAAPPPPPAAVEAVKQERPKPRPPVRAPVKEPAPPKAVPPVKRSAVEPALPVQLSTTPSTADAPFVFGPRVVAELAAEVEAKQASLASLPVARRTAQVALWGGRARLIQDHLKLHEPSPQASALKKLLGTLSRIAREHRCWVLDVLSPEWRTDWATLIQVQASIVSGHAVDADAEELKTYWRSVLTRLLDARREVALEEASFLLERGAKVLSPTDGPLLRARMRFGALAQLTASAPTVH